MVYPREFQPTGFERVCVPGRLVEIPKARPSFRLWHGPHPSDDYGGKAILESEGQPVFAEIAILRAFERSGWKGVWVDSYRQRHRHSYWDDQDNPILPSDAVEVLNQIRSTARAHARCWDVFCWRRDGTLVFAEAKRRGRDRLRASQLAWLDAALRIGRQLTDFIVIEWQLDEMRPAD